MPKELQQNDEDGNLNDNKEEVMDNLLNSGGNPVEDRQSTEGTTLTPEQLRIIEDNVREVKQPKE